MWGGEVEKGRFVSLLFKVNEINIGTCLSCFSIL
jgi:hypothetical protein